MRLYFNGSPWSDHFPPKPVSTAIDAIVEILSAVPLETAQQVQGVEIIGQKWTRSDLEGAASVLRNGWSSTLKKDTAPDTKMISALNRLDRIFPPASLYLPL